MLKYKVTNSKFKGFMVDSTMANQNVVYIVYNSGFANEKMENHELTCLLYWKFSLQKTYKEAF